jgi:hypothetical protein
MKFKTIDISQLDQYPESWKPNYIITWRDNFLDELRSDEVMVFQSKSDQKYYAIPRHMWLSYEHVPFTYDEASEQWLLFGEKVSATWEELS